MSAVPVPSRAPARAGRRPALRVAPEPRRRHTLVFALLVLALGAGMVFAAVSLNALAAGDAVVTRQLEHELVQAERRYAQLVVEVAGGEDPGRIRAVAVEGLGMIPAESPRFLVVERVLPSDGRVSDAVPEGATTDPLKPVLSAER